MTQTVTTLANGDKQVVITGTETWVIPADWNDAANKIEAYGCGGSALTGVSGASSGGGGGGASSTISTGGVGSTGVLVITYTPLTSSTPGRFFFLFG